MRNIEKIIEEVNGSMTMEGMPLTEDDKTRIRFCAGNKDRVEKTIEELVAKHTTTNKMRHEQRL